MMQHRMCIAGSKAKTEGRAFEATGTDRVLMALDPSPVRQGRGAAHLGGQGGARRGRTGRRRKTQKRIRSDVESCAGTSGAGRAAGLLARGVVTRRPLARFLTFLSILSLLFSLFLFFLFFLSFLFPLLFLSFLSFLFLLFFLP